MEVQEKACGCLVIENEKILLIRQLSGAWGFPKGHVENGETEEETAIREVKEETNIEVKINPQKRYTMNYTTDKGLYKEVVLFMAEKVGGYLRKQDAEIIQAGWFDYKDALETLTYDNTKELLKKVIKENNL